MCVSLFPHPFPLKHTLTYILISPISASSRFSCNVHPNLTLSHQPPAPISFFPFGTLKSNQTSDQLFLSMHTQIEVMRTSMERDLQACTEEVQMTYGGQQAVTNIVETTLASVQSSPSDVTPVVQAILQALLNSRPSGRYPVHGTTGSVDWGIVSVQSWFYCYCRCCRRRCICRHHYHFVMIIIVIIVVLPFSSSEVVVYRWGVLSGLLRSCIYRHCCCRRYLSRFTVVIIVVITIISISSSVFVSIHWWFQCCHHRTCRRHYYHHLNYWTAGLPL